MNRKIAAIWFVAVAALAGCLVPVGTYPAAESREFVIHKIAKGDTWDKLAAQYGVSVDELLFYNGYRWRNGDNWLFLGHELKVPMPVQFRHPSVSPDAVVDRHPTDSGSESPTRTVVEIGEIPF